MALSCPVNITGGVGVGGVNILKYSLLSISFFPLSGRLGNDGERGEIKRAGTGEKGKNVPRPGFFNFPIFVLFRSDNRKYVCSRTQR